MQYGGSHAPSHPCRPIPCRHMPSILKAISPHYGVRFFVGSPRAAWVSLGGIVLCISGSEAISADLGHFSRRAISVHIYDLLFLCLSAKGNKGPVQVLFASWETQPACTPIWPRIWEHLGHKPAA